MRWQQAELSYCRPNLRVPPSLAQLTLHSLVCAESPASSLSSAGSLFSQKAPTLPPGWLQLKDPEGRAFYMHAATQQTTWTFPTTA